jgi:hypothetical protein
MSDPSDEFDGIDFDRPWDEGDWERFFDAQDRLALGRPVGAAPQRPGADPGLSFRRVLRQFGMDPDNPEAEPRSFFLAEPAAPVGGKFPFWRAGADHERLPIYLQARDFAARSADLVERRFAKLMGKTYASVSHRNFQRGLAALDDQARPIPRLIALGHRVGYDPFGAVGNIVRCRQALERAEACVSLLSRLPRRHMERPLYNALFGESARLRNALLEWIHLLQNRFAARTRRRP